jgi:hypothetical protein
MSRARWLAAGMAVGVGGTLWAERRVRSRVHQAIERLQPTRVAEGVTASARDVGVRVQGAIAAGRDERSRREAELWRQLRGEHPTPMLVSTGASAGPSTRRSPGRSQARR